MSLDQEFESIKQFNKDNIDTLFIHLENSNILDYRKNKKYKYGSEDHFVALKEKFISGREVKIEKEQLSEPDPALYFAIKTKRLFWEPKTEKPECIFFICKIHHI